ncbi:LLM class flavin-dependent oxidoreductase [Actinomadura barringtoniae]|uniref:LLM class flavin-dependent oxidoreductase n=1 Tax=Actinomadura barringtoniae TaxID=1427535 RepID=A0A939PAV5_9ACTN|nr:TIGR03619 family F420-dependent LLM class oxidoreductase [Actinomadura barringtoniae]MBO2449195.1 LLM class flavin-dependent oxidoreductase [Actinomadura barringtoniae]
MTEQLQVGFLLPTRDRIVLGDHDVGPLIRLARRAEELGFDSVWAGDSPVTRQRADVLTLLPAIAAVTERVTLGTAVLLPALRHPIPLAHQLATIDRIADGRLIAGMGGGFPNPATAAQFEAIGVDFRTRVSRLEESIEAMRRLWTEDAVTFEGRHFRFEDITVAPKPVQQGGPPVWLAGGGERAMRRVGRIADGWLPYPPRWETYVEERAVLPPNVTPALYATVCLDDDPERGRKRLRTSIERYYNNPLEVIESIQAMYAGPPEGVREWLGRYVDSGARHVVIRLAVDDHEAALGEFAERVLPLVREGVRS